MRLTSGARGAASESFKCRQLEAFWADQFVAKKNAIGGAFFSAANA